MRSRIVWFVAGSAAGVYATAKARRAAYRLSVPGLVDQAAALGSGWRAFSAEVRDGMETREDEIVHQLSGATHDHSDLLRLQAEHTDKDRT
ncbi:hypothetical protein C6I20_09125 [Aeromicrobium sp. A1-2]|uniref:DUF6167 family protein n=1 Tax=Aeromicrobium sp. A1-2 TaxID=2107713 RepID=UPI000E49775C|nr:DUF6167 family protein [Aeromicrobium sp. A1-2]AXT85332.1 hypothetical protein C6I20_09125 [Aeromicrobium sp. A1-2]